MEEPKNNPPLLLVSRKQGKSFKQFSSFEELRTGARVMQLLTTPYNCSIQGLPEWCNKEYTAKEQGNTVSFNPFTLVCSCPEYALLAAAYGPDTVNRCCRHITRFIVARLQPGLAYPLNMIFKNRARYGAEELYIIQAKGEQWIIGRKENSPWLTVYAEGKVFSFNAVQYRWRNGFKPEKDLFTGGSGAMPW